MVEVWPVEVSDDLSAFPAPHGLDVDEPRRRRTLVAVDGADVIGTATAMWSRRHPDLVFAAIDVIPGRRRRGVDTSLVAALAELAGRPLLGNVEPSREVAEFLARCGFAIVAESRTVRIHLGAASDAIDRLRTDAVPGSSDVRIEPSPSLSDDVIDFFEHSYAASHGWAGRYTPAPDAPWAALAGPPLDVPGAVQVAWRGDDVVAATSLHSGPFATAADAFLLPTGVLSDEPLDRRSALLGELVRRSLGAARDAGLRSVNAEFDLPAHGDLASVIDRLPADVTSRRQLWLHG